MNVEYVNDVKAYNVPFEINSADRLTDLSNFTATNIKVGNDDYEFTYSFESTISAEFTLNSADRFNYLKITSSLFGANSVSYWFLTSIASIVSDTGTRYSATLDVWGTFNNEIKNQMNGQNIPVRRMHTDRYTYDSNNQVFNLVKTHRSLLNSDFNVPNTKGMDVVRKGYNVSNDGEFHMNRCVNTVINNEKIYYTYAFINMLGNPRITPNDVIYYGVNVSTTVIAPIDVNNVYAINPLVNMQKLQQDKIVSIVLSPYDIAKNTDADERTAEMTTIYVKNDGSRGTANDYEWSFDIYKDSSRILRDVVGFPQAYLKKLSGDVEDSSDNTVMDHIKTKITKSAMNIIVNNNDMESVEIGLYNQDISPIKVFYNHSDSIELDIYNFLNYKKNEIQFGMSPQGVTSIYQISDSQIITFSENHLVSFSTDMGKNYLARNTASINAAIVGEKLRRKKEYIEYQTEQTRMYSGNVINAAFSIVNPLSHGVQGAMSRVDDYGQYISDNNIKKINATINDAAGSAPSMNVGSGNQVEPLMNGEYKWKINYVMYRPSKIIRNKIVNHFDRFGYKVDDYININTNSFTSRSKFNYFEIDDLKDYLHTTDIFDVDVVKLINAEFIKGLRIWHGNNINYTNMNVEKIIVDNV